MCVGTREYLPHSQRKKFLGLGVTQVDLELLVRPDSLVAISFQIFALLWQCFQALSRYT